MVKQFKLIIPDLIPRNELMKLQKWMFDILTIGDGQIITEDHRCFKYIPKEWLKENKPMSANDVWSSHINGESLFDDEISIDDFLKIWNLCEENEQLKHDPEQNFYEWAKTTGRAPSDLGYDLLKEGWMACEKNRGYDE